MDIDHFKALNDRYGHPAGDDCLKRIATVVESFGNRPGDLAARYGGEELALVMGNTALQQAERMAASILQAVRDLEIPHEESGVSAVATASLGVATMCPRQGGDERALVEASDKCLYLAKVGGRNRVVAG